MSIIYKTIAILALTLCMLPMNVTAKESKSQTTSPVIAFTATPSYGENAPFVGVVFTKDQSSFDTSKYRVMLWMEYYGFWPKLTYERYYTDLNSDGSFVYAYCSNANDVNAKILHFFLVPSDFALDFGDKSELARQKAFEDTRSKAIDCVKIERSENGVVKVDPYREAPEQKDIALALPSGLLPVKNDKIAVNVGFYTEKGTAPDQALSEDLIRQHLSAVAKFSDTVRFYKATGTIDKAYRMAKELGLTVIGSAYLTSDKSTNKKEMDGLIKLCNEGYCKIAVVGNEVLMNNFLKPEELVAAINYVREGIKDKTIPVTTSENYDQILSTPSVRNACNMILVNHYPFLGGADIDHAAEYFISNMNVLKSICNNKELVVSETGWSTYPNEANAARYYQEIREWSMANNIQVCYFESTDEAWKGEVSNGQELDKHWGFMTNDFMVKECYKRLNPFDLNIQVSAVTVSPKTLTLTAGESSTLSAKIEPIDATDKTLTWTSTNPAVAKVDNKGKVTAIKRGNALIEATSTSGKSDACEVKVNNIEPTGISVDKQYLTIRVGETVKLNASIEPKNTSNISMWWTSSHNDIAKIDEDGNITGISPGFTLVRANVIGKDGTINSICYVNVLPEKLLDNHPVISFTFTPAIGDESNFKGVVHTENGSDYDTSKYHLSCWLEYGGQLYPKPYYSQPYTKINNDGSFSIKYHTSTNDSKSRLLYFFLLPSDETPSSFVAMSEKAVDFVRVERNENGGIQVVPDRKSDDPAACRVFGFCSYKGKQYWYEHWQRQGTMSDPKNIIGDGSPRGREIYDPESDGWYWLDSIYDGAKAQGKEVWIPYIYQDENTWSNDQKRKIAHESDPGMGDYVYDCMLKKDGKWVRYDENGKMLKGWVTITGSLAKIYPKQAGNRYYYDHRTGLMAKGYINIGGNTYHFDEITGVLIN